MRFRTITALALAGAALLALAGCTPDPLADQYRAGGTTNYISGNGFREWRDPGARPVPVDFVSVTEAGDEVSLAGLRGEVAVLNFWYASCPPCRAEAKDLEAVYQKFQSEGVQFLGVNVRDQAPQARAFAEKFGVTYPSVIDSDGKAQNSLIAVGATVADAVPSTVILDREGHVAATVLGQLQDPSILETLIKDVLAEQGSGSPEPSAGD